MESQNQFPKTLVEAAQYFGQPDNAFNFMVGLRWPNGVCCPRCGSHKIGFITTRKVWECKECETKKQFTVKVGTIFEDSALGLDKWLLALWLIANAKNGISSYELHRSIGVTQKTAWFMLHRIRLAMQAGSFETFGGTVESDETFIGGRVQKMNSKRRSKADVLPGPHSPHYVQVVGLLERSTEDKASRVKVQPVNDRQQPTIFPLVLKHVKHGSNFYTDSSTSYIGMKHAYNHERVDHMAKEYVRGKVHTNGIENFWSVLKRTIKGTYVSVEPVHLWRYLDEQTFRFNERTDCDSGRFVKICKGVIGKGLTYLDLISGKGGEDLPPSTAAAR